MGLRWGLGVYCFGSTCGLGDQHPSQEIVMEKGSGKIPRAFFLDSTLSVPSVGSFPLAEIHFGRCEVLARAFERPNLDLEQHLGLRSHRR